ncbi:OmpA family protein [Stutzerimonas zhaodongensis]|uniref:OmpA family protein n=2 Tax=Pseudomonadaceae TaxID=135621 RepID=A0A365PQC8_9GAMM|nr:OmpA family protein [Stutzerimonas zhaodongensis]RBA53566.1 OmpA family protein [Stutzerimonas zhaodongensis]
MHHSFRLTALSCAFLTIAGCSNQQMQGLKDSVTTIGKDYGMPVLCGVGIIAGGAAGYALKGNDGALIGAAAGGAIGCALGHAWQSRLQELDRIAKEENLKITTEQLTVASGAIVTAVPKDAGLVTQIEDSGMFSSDSDRLTDSGTRAVTKLAQMYAKPTETDPQAATEQLQTRRLLVVGHSDATGGAAYNQKLSERRARTVGKALVRAGIPSTSIFYQGAGSSRPIADNSDPLVRGQNRRVEIVELANEQALAMRAQAEAGNTKYLQYGTSTTAKPKANSGQTAEASQSKSAPTPVQTTASKTPASPALSAAKQVAKAEPAVDFAGKPAQAYNWTMAQNIRPKSSGFELISSARASEMPMVSCEADMPRNAGAILSMADDKPLQRRATRDYLPGYNNRVWANTVNGHLVTVSPVSILRENAQVDRQPIVQVVKDYDQNSRKAQTIKAVANTYEGESQVLYRVFASDAKTPVSCMDLVFSKGNAKVTEGALYYPAGSEAYMASFMPIPATK